MMETYKKKIKFCYNLTCRLSAFSISPYFLPDFSLPTIRTIIYSTSVWATASLPLGLTVCILRTLTFHVPSMVFAHAVPTICNASPPHPHPLGLSSVTPPLGSPPDTTLQAGTGGSFGGLFDSCLPCSPDHNPRRSGLGALCHP